MEANLNSLQLISTYNNSESESEDNIEETENVSENKSVSIKRKNIEEEEKSHKRLPLPSIISTLYNPPEPENQDNPEEHEGRIRTFAHERGNWSTYVYIPFEINCIFKSFLDEMLHLNDNFKVIENPHLSLTRTVILRHHWIDSFVESIQQKLQGSPSFRLNFKSIKIYTNDEKTRTFLGITVGLGEKNIKELVTILDKCLEEFKLPEFYKDPSFHMSILWTLGDLKSTLDKSLEKFNKLFEDSLNNNPEDWSLYVNHLICKTGNKFFRFMLDS